jgi:hypothetical protein
MTLTEAAALTKKSVYFIGGPVVTIFIIWIILGILNPPQRLPEKYITPDYMCGPLPQFEMKALPQKSSSAKISIETSSSGAVPELVEVVNVFEYDHPGQSLLALEKSQVYAERLDFNPDDYERISTTEYKWEDSKTSRSLTIETGNLNMHLQTDFTDPDVDTFSQTLPSTSQAKTAATDFLRKNNLLTDDLLSADQEAYLIQITASGEMREAPSLGEADLIRVDFFRTKSLITVDPKYIKADEFGPTIQDKLEEEEATTIRPEEGQEVKRVKKINTKVVNDNPIFGNVSVYVGGKDESHTGEYKIFKMDHINWPIAKLACGTYKLISPEEAVRQVQDGNATLAHLAKKNSDRIKPYEAQAVNSMTIFEVDIVYLDKQEKQQFLQPIYMIEGEAIFEDSTKGVFTYYVPAIDYGSIPEDAGKKQPQEEENSSTTE